MEKYVIETQHLYKRFGQVTALEDINIQIAEGEFVAIMGGIRIRQNYTDEHSHWA